MQDKCPKHLYITPGSSDDQVLFFITLENLLHFVSEIPFTLRAFKTQVYIICVYSCSMCVE